MDSVKKSKFSFKIGTKLGLMSGLGIAIVVAMVGNTIYGNALLKSANDIAAKELTLAYEFAEAKASIRGLISACAIFASPPQERAWTLELNISKRGEQAC